MTVRCSRLLRGRKRPGLDVSIFICSPDLGLEWIECNPCPGETIRDHFKGQLLAHCDVPDTVRSTIIEHRRSDEMMDRLTDLPTSSTGTAAQSGVTLQANQRDLGRAPHNAGRQS